MSNQLLVPFKLTTQPPIAQAVRDCISTNHYDTHPETFAWDVTHWEALRSDVSKGAVHGTVVDNVLKCVHLHSIALTSHATILINNSVDIMLNSFYC